MLLVALAAPFGIVIDMGLRFAPCREKSHIGVAWLAESFHHQDRLILAGVKKRFVVAPLFFGLVAAWAPDEVAGGGGVKAGVEFAAAHNVVAGLVAQSALVGCLLVVVGRVVGAHLAAVVFVARRKTGARRHAQWRGADGVFEPGTALG